MVNYGSLIFYKSLTITTSAVGESHFALQQTEGKNVSAEKNWESKAGSKEKADQPVLQEN